jgi:hypothetical protein
MLLCWILSQFAQVVFQYLAGLAAPMSLGGGTRLGQLGLKTTWHDLIIASQG